ncbi:ATP-binding protein, partial [Staphylococcus aureus]|nr:ATP-binding protein [Staphylococcus aureus]
MIESMVKVAAFPFKKEISDIDFNFQPSINQQEIWDFTDLRFIEKISKHCLFRLKWRWQNTFSYRHW